MKQKVKFKGQLKLYMQWPAIMTILLVAMNIWMYTISRRSALLMSAFVIAYMIIVAILYFYNREIIMADLLQFATQYGTVQNSLLKQLDMPYALTLEDGRIIWVNDAFSEQITSEDVVEKYLGKVMPEINRGMFPKEEDQPHILEVVHDDRELTVEIRKVCVQGLGSTEQLLDIPEDQECFYAISLRDDTELHTYIRQNEDQRLIAGLIYIDNYDEILESVEEVRQSLLVALVDRKINQYIANIDGIVKKLEKDKYFIVIKKKHFAQIEADKFSLLEEVKSVNIGNRRSATLSIGLGLSTDTYAQSYNFARVAIDLALARGGDQAVYKNCNGITYFGGKKEQAAKNTRVKARVKAEALREFIAGKDQVIVMGHKIADVDSFGAAVGIYRAAQALEKPAHIVINEITTSVRPLFDAFMDNAEYPEDMFLSSFDVKNYLTNSTMVIVVDTNKPDLTDCPELLAKGNTIAVLDHHRQSSTIIENAILSYVEPYASSTSEMVAEVLQYIVDDIHIRNIEADCMYAGIMIDTDNFMNKTGVRTFEAAAFLRRNGADITRIRKMFREDMSSYRAKAETIQNAEVYRHEFAIAECPNEGLKSPTIIGAQAANGLLDIKGIKASFVFTEYNGKIYLSARAIDEVNVQSIAERLGGGGHVTIAGAQFQHTNMKKAIGQLKETLDDMLQEGEL